MTLDLLFTHVDAVTMNAQNMILRDTCVGISGSRIAYIGGDQPDVPVKRRVDGRRRVLMPGLCNAHTHIAMTQLRGYADDYNLQDWLDNHIFPAEAKMTDDMVYWGSLLAAMECIASGTVSVTDMYDHMNAVGRAIDESGMMANLTRALLHFGPDYDLQADPRAAEMRELIDRYHNRDSGRIRIDAAIHAEYTSPPALWEQISAFAAENHLGMNVHLSETRREHEECRERYGKTPAAVLAERGVFDVRATAAHCVWLEPEDRAILAAKGVTAVHNPVSNLKLASGIADVPAMLNAGINVALGTDGVASNNSHDMFEEIKTAAMLHKAVTGDPTAISAPQALRMAVTGGLTAQGRGGDTGQVAVGRDADLILVDMDRPHLTPCHNVVSNLVYAARGSDVIMTMVRGRVLYENGAFLTIDAERVMHETRRVAGMFGL